MPKLDLGLPSYDALFSTEEERQEANTEKVMKIPINKIKDFEGHPFHVTMDEDMAKLIDSIKENDMLMPGDSFEKEMHILQALHRTLNIYYHLNKELVCYPIPNLLSC